MCSGVACFPKAEIRAVGNDGARLRSLQAGWLFPTPTPADTLLTGGWATGVERRSESEREEIGAPLRHHGRLGAAAPGAGVV